MKQFIVILCVFISTYSIGQVGIGTTTPDDALDVIGDTQVSGYLRVGNPATPQTVTNTGTQLFTMGGASYFSGFTQNGCGTIWSGTITGTTTTDTAIMQYDNVGTRGNQNLVSPHIWVPSNVNSIVVEISHYCTLENGFDGVFIEYSTDNGGTWNKVLTASFFLGGYTGNVNGPTNCGGGNLNEPAWTGNQNQMVSAFPLTLTNTWVQFRFVGTEDNSGNQGEYNLQNFTVFSDSFSGGSGGGFTAGNIYAENNIYAGSNVLLGDLAEYFPTVGKTEKGDVISYIKGDNDLFSVSTKQNDPNIIGIYSSNPTLTLNNPNSGVPVALQGRVPVNVIGEVIRKGDYLTSSSVPGKAMKANGSSFVVGRALEDFKGGVGQVICLVETGWKNLNIKKSQNQLSAKAVFPKEKNIISIKNNAVKKDSQIFITFNGDIGSRFWVNEINDGSFNVCLGEKAISDVKFIYLIDNAFLDKMVEKPLDNHTDSYPKKDKLYIKEKNAMLTTSNIPVNESIVSPPVVKDSTKSYVWTERNGIEENIK